MRIAGIVLVWVGVLMLLQNLRIIPPLTWNIVWPVLIIIVGSSLKYFNHGVACGLGGKCNTCNVGNNHVCVGPDCTHENK